VAPTLDLLALLVVEVVEEEQQLVQEVILLFHRQIQARNVNHLFPKSCDDGDDVA
jgi:hypothetical protein